MRRLGLAATLLALLLVPASAQARDRDHDKLPDRWEKKFHISTKAKSGLKDPDRDGLSNLGEFRSKTSPRRSDTDRDGIRDGDEDADRDAVDNANETREGTRPRDRDSDNDGRSDGREDRDRDHLNNAGEDRTGNDPIDRDTDDDGIRDGDERAGTVVAFDDSDGLPSVLTIGLTGGTSVSGMVTAATKIKCETEDEAEGHYRSRARASNEDADDERTDDAADDAPAEDGPEEADGEDRDDADGEAGGSCTIADLAVGAIIHEGEGRVVNGALVFTEIEVLKQ